MSCKRNQEESGQQAGVGGCRWRRNAQLLAKKLRRKHHSNGQRRMEDNSKKPRGNNRRSISHQKIQANNGDSELATVPRRTGHTNIQPKSSIYNPNWRRKRSLRLRKILGNRILEKSRLRTSLAGRMRQVQHMQNGLLFRRYLLLHPLNNGIIYPKT